MADLFELAVDSRVLIGKKSQACATSGRERWRRCCETTYRWETKRMESQPINQHSHRDEHQESVAPILLINCAKSVA